MSSEPIPHQGASSLSETRFDRLYAGHYRAVLAYCLRRTNSADAQDAVAETFLVAWRKLDEVPAGPDTLPWLYGVAYRVLSHRYRRTRRDTRIIDRLRVQPVQVEPGPELQVVRSSEHDQVHRAAQRLKPADREILQLAMWEELSHPEISTALGISAQSARQRFHRAKQRLAREFTRLDNPNEPPMTAPRGGAA